MFTPFSANMCLNTSLTIQYGQVHSPNEAGFTGGPYISSCIPAYVAQNTTGTLKCNVHGEWINKVLCQSKIYINKFKNAGDLKCH